MKKNKVIDKELKKIDKYLLVNHPFWWRINIAYISYRALTANLIIHLFWFPVFSIWLSDYILINLVTWTNGSASELGINYFDLVSLFGVIHILLLNIPIFRIFGFIYENGLLSNRKKIFKIVSPSLFKSLKRNLNELVIYLLLYITLVLYSIREVILLSNYYDLGILGVHPIPSFIAGTGMYWFLVFVSLISKDEDEIQESIDNRTPKSKTKT